MGHPLDTDWIQIGLGERLAVDRHPAAGIAACHVIARQPDDSPDVVARADRRFPLDYHVTAMDLRGAVDEEALAWPDRVGHGG
jgi:hypothetical protein